MALYTKSLARVFQNRTPLVFYQSNRFYEKQGQTGAPYRPWPMEQYFWQKSGDEWTKTYPAQSEKADEYEKEEVYLDEIEERMKKYDRKYAQSDKVKHLYNEFGWEKQDDRAFINYGGGLGGIDETQWGRGKKIDPSQYINADFTHTNRKPIPPVEYMTPEQVRRSRGSLANMRELPSESPSIWKYWNLYTTGAVALTFLAAKEYMLLGGHDMFDALLYWAIFGCAGAAAGDWIAWWHALVSQEVYDREYFILNDKCKKMNQQLEIIASKPNEKRILLGMSAYREELAQKVLAKTLSNRSARSINATLKKLNDKMNQENGIRKDAQSKWQKDALDGTFAYFDDNKVQNAFTQEAIKLFCAPDAASLETKSTIINMQSNHFKSKYDQLYSGQQTVYMNDQKAQGTLSWVFVDDKERKSKQLTKANKEKEFTNRVKAWETAHNPVGKTEMPAFA